MAFRLRAESRTILRAYCEVGVHWANPASIQSRATIGQPVKHCSLVEINDQRRSKDRRPNCCLWCLFVWLFAISELNWWKVLSCHYFVYNYGYPFYPLKRDMETLSPCVRFYKCVIIARYNIVLRCRDVRWNNFKYVCIIFIMGKTDCAINGMCVYMGRSQNFQTSKP